MRDELILPWQISALAGATVDLWQLHFCQREVIKIFGVKSYIKNFPSQIAGRQHWCYFICANIADVIGAEHIQYQLYWLYWGYIHIFTELMVKAFLTYLLTQGMFVVGTKNNEGKLQY